MSTYLKAVKILRYTVCAHAIVVDYVSTIFRVVTHAPGPGSLVVVLWSLLCRELEVADASEERLCWPHVNVRACVVRMWVDK